MTNDRDIRFTPAQILVTQQALRSEIKLRTRSIKKAEASRRAGGTVQHNVLESHYEAREAATQVLGNLEVARIQLQRNA